MSPATGPDGLFPTRLRERRIACGFTQPDLAEIAQKAVEL